jgi:serine/threonine-protein kinase PknK
MRGESEGAVALWRQGLTVGLQLADPRGIGALIERLALAAATEGQSQSAAWLLGAADAQLRMVGMELQHDELQHLGFPADRRRTLTEAFEEAWSDGLASSVAEAVDVALQVTAVLRQPMLV